MSFSHDFLLSPGQKLEKKRLRCVEAVTALITVASETAPAFKKAIESLGFRNHSRKMVTDDAVRKMIESIEAYIQEYDRDFSFWQIAVDTNAQGNANNYVKSFILEGQGTKID